MTANIRSACVRLVGKYLLENGQFFQKEPISFSDDINNSKSDVNDFNIVYSHSNNTVTTTNSTSVNHITLSNSQFVSASSTTHNTEKLNCNDDDDDWNEDNEILNE